MRRAVFLVPALLASVGMAVPAHAQRVHEEILPGVVRSFADAAAQSNAEASVALVGEFPAIGPLPEGFGAPLPIFLQADGRETVAVPLEPGTNVYATGFVSGPLERTGRAIENYNLDNFAWNDNSNRNYQTHPWVVCVREDGTSFGVLFDSTWYSYLDTVSPDQIWFQTEGASPRVITIESDSPQGVVMRLADLTGKPFMPPMWSVGYHQSKYSYFPQSNVLFIADEFRRREIPIDVLWHDIDYMDGFRNFSFNTFAFPDPAQLNADLDARDISAVWMANCGQKVDGGWSVYQEMVAQDLAVKSPNRVSDFQGDVWPGNSVWPDYTMRATRDWWAGRVSNFAGTFGVDGIWNDMNEPAVFNVGSKTMPDNNWHRADDELGGPGVHRRYHNIYGMQMSRATREGMLQAFPDKRPFVLTRAGYMGGHRYAAMWTGDNVANWYHVDVSIQNILNIGLSGQPNAGPDIGGFNGDGGGDQYARWMGIGALMPFARGHYGFSSLDREPWSYGPDTENTSRLALNRRYRLLNHIYTGFYEAHTTGLPVARPLFFAEPDNPELREWDNGFLIRDGLLIVGATAPGAVPQVPPMETPVYQIAFPRTNGFPLPSDDQDADLPDLYVLAGHIVPANAIVQSSRALSETRSEAIELFVALDEDGNARGTMYEDDGDGYGYLEGGFVLYEFEATTAGGQTTVEVRQIGGADTPQVRDWTVKLLFGGTQFGSATVSGATPSITLDSGPGAPEAQPTPTDLDGRELDHHFGVQNRLATNDGMRFSEISQLRTMYAIADEAGLRVGLAGEMAIDGTALALMIDAGPGGQTILRTPNGSPPAGLDPLEGTVLEEGFTPEGMLFLNAFDGSVFCDWVTLPDNADGTKTYLGRSFLGSDDSTLSGGNNFPGIRVALGAGGHRTNAGFEIFIPSNAIGLGNGPCNEIRLFAAVVKPWGAITNQTLPASGDSWPGLGADFNAIPGKQFATVVRALDPDVNADGVIDAEDIYALQSNPTDINGDGTFDRDDVRTLTKRVRAGEAEGGRR